MCGGRRWAGCGRGSCRSRARRTAAGYAGAGSTGWHGRCRDAGAGDRIVLSLHEHDRQRSTAQQHDQQDSDSENLPGESDVGHGTASSVLGDGERKDDGAVNRVNAHLHSLTARHRGAVRHLELNDGRRFLGVFRVVNQQMEVKMTFRPPARADPAPHHLRRPDRGRCGDVTRGRRLSRCRRTSTADAGHQRAPPPSGIGLAWHTDS